MYVFDLYGAGDRIRTRDRLITNQLLYQLSYASFNRTKPLIKHRDGSCNLRQLDQ